jgi:hypothetical protein
MLIFEIAKPNRRLGSFCLSTLLVLAFVVVARGQTSSFTYQGRLTDGGIPANGTYEIRFTLWDANAGGTQQPQPAPVSITRPNVQVSAGAFAVQPLNFGVAAFPGADRFLEISVRRNVTDPFTTLSPRQQITSTPYSLRSLTAAQAEVALDANKLGGVDAGQYVTTTSVGNTFLKNTTTQQTGASLSIDGNGTIGGTLQASQVRAKTATGVYGLTHSDGTTTVGTYIGGSSSGASGGWFGTQSNDNLYFFTNNGQPSMTVATTGNVGIGTATPRTTLDVAGNAVQDRDKGGLVKAMLYADGTFANPRILRCYNGSTGSSTGDCGFTLTQTSRGSYEISFGFQVSDRFVSLTAKLGSLGVGFGTANMGANFGFDSNNTVLLVHTFYSVNSDSFQDAAFMLIVY